MENAIPTTTADLAATLKYEDLDVFDACKNADCGFGTCQPLIGEGYTCHCQTGYTGDNCTTPDTCSLSECNGGKCAISNDGETYCLTCPDGFLGASCDEIDGEVGFWYEWSNWSACDTPCGVVGSRSRHRKCKKRKSKCKLSAREERPCNVEECEASDGQTNPKPFDQYDDFEGTIGWWHPDIIKNGLKMRSSITLRIKTAVVLPNKQSPCNGKVVGINYNAKKSKFSFYFAVWRSFEQGESYALAAARSITSSGRGAQTQMFTDPIAVSKGDSLGFLPAKKASKLEVEAIACRRPEHCLTQCEFALELYNRIVNYENIKSAKVYKVHQPTSHLLHCQVYAFNAVIKCNEE
ncbi:uncharacterized protein LOC141915237 [Tubulanus polymorphus]|uniref:uncharacterized protein LOC141915237 n=1 Tax=Tubulanus polymorphus TaxID=672921 RepID=UPI003DA4A1D2